MNEPAASPLPPQASPRVPFRVHLACYGILAVLMVYALVFRWLRPVLLEDPVQIDPGRVAQVEHRVDPNTATWPELAGLPGIGEALAKRIVAYREDHHRANGGGSTTLVFRSPEDLDAVKGIGPKLVERLRPHLRFAPEQAASQPTSLDRTTR